MEGVRLRSAGLADSSPCARGSVQLLSIGSTSRRLCPRCRCSTCGNSPPYDRLFPSELAMYAIAWISEACRRPSFKLFTVLRPDKRAASCRGGQYARGEPTAPGEHDDLLFRLRLKHASGARYAAAKCGV
jgi:hypothetical protein